MHWLHTLHHQPHSLPEDCPQAGAQWSPDVQQYDRNRPPFPVHYSDEEKQAQFEAGDRLRNDLDRALGEGAKNFTIYSAVYRIREALVIEGTESFTLNARNVELIVEPVVQHWRIINNKNLTVLGPLIMDADPMGFTQGELVDLDKEAFTLDVRIFDGYDVPTEGDRIELFTEEGVMLPHGQDPIRGFTDLGDGVVRLQMNDFTFSQHDAAVDDILKPGHLVAIEIKGKGGLEMRENQDTTWEDITLCTHGLAWALPELGEDKFIRWSGTRRRDTNRLVGGGFHLMTFSGGAFTLLDSELGHNFDDLTDINTFHTFAFNQVGPRQFHIMDEHAKEGHMLTLHDYTTMQCYSECRIEALEDQPEQPVKEQFTQLAEKYNVRDLGAPRLCTVDSDIQLPEFSYVSIVPAKNRVMRFERNYLHDGLSAGINPKGADRVIIRDNIIERAAGYGIAVSFDPYWWEGNPSRNIEIVGNTVRNCPYGPGNNQPGISVYVGGSYTGLPGPEGTAQLQEHIRITNNAVYTSGGAGISVTNSKDVEISNNIITDCDLGGFGHGAIYLNAVSEGTRVTGNVFVGNDASADAVQIKTGIHTPPQALVLENNRAANPEVGVPQVAWHFSPATGPGIELHGDGWNLEGSFPCQHQQSHEPEATAVFKFDGSRVRVLGMRSPLAGLADVFIDDQFAGTADASRQQERLGGFYTSPILPEGEHIIRIVNRAERGEASRDDARFLTVHGFDVLPAGAGECQWDPREGPRA